MARPTARQLIEDMVVLDNLGAADVRLDDAQLARLDAATRLALGYPYEFLHERRAARSAVQ